MFKAIVANSLSSVDHILKLDCRKASVPLRIPDVRPEPDVEGFDLTTLVLADAFGDTIFPLHLAVRNLYTRGFSNEHVSMALRIIESLLAHGASVSVLCAVTVSNIERYKWFPFGAVDAIALAVGLKAHAKDNFVTAKALETAVAKMLVEKGKGGLQLPMQPCATSTVGMCARLRKDESCADVTFVSLGGEMIRAHKCVLVAASAYFKTMFQGETWRESPSGEVHSVHSHAVLCRVLDFVYLGRVQPSREIESWIALLAAASEYLLEPLSKLSVAWVKHLLRPEGVRAVLELHLLHSCDELLTAAVELAQADAATVLVRPEIIALATEQPQLWATFAGRVSGSKGEAKRMRTV